jgi:tetratricopeptide (TPR) repeat protein
MSEPADDERSTNQLSDDGFAALHDERYDEVLTIATELRKRRFSACFELEARARWEMGEREAAIAVLEEGVAKAAAAPPLWHWLGCYRSDIGRYEAALEAFEREAEFEVTSVSTNTYNVAIVYERMDRPADGIEVLARLESPGDEGPTAEHFDELRARLLFDLGRFDECVETATRVIDTLAAHAAAEVDESDVDYLLLSRAYAARAMAHLRLGDAAAATEDAEQSIAAAGGGAQTPQWAMQALREAAGEKSPTAKWFDLILTVHFPAPQDGSIGFVVRMGIVADHVDEAVRLARPFLPPETGESRPRVEVQSAEPAIDEFKGVAHVQARIYFASEDEDDDEPLK